MKRQALGPMKQREKRKGPACQDQRIKESPVQRTRPGSPEVANGLGSSGRAAQLRWDWDSSKGSTKKTQGTKDRCVLLKHPVTQRGIRRLGVTIHEQVGKWLGKPSTQQEWILLTWEKWQEEGQPKAKSKKVKKPKSWGQLPKDTSEWKVSKGLLGRQHQRDRIMRNKERTNPLSDWHSTGFGT